MTKSYEECGKIVYRLYSSCIKSVQKINEDFIEFFLSTWTWSKFKLPWLKSYTLPLISDLIDTNRNKKGVHRNRLMLGV